MRWSALMCAGVLVAVGCAPAGGQVFHSSAGDFVVQTAAEGLAHPWALAFLPDRRMLTTERPGRMRIIAQDGTLSPALAGVPKVFASGQGGLLDLVLDRSFAQNHTIYFCYAEPVDGGARTALVRAPAAIISAAASCRRRTTISFSQWANISPPVTRRRIWATISARSSASGRMARFLRTILSSAARRPSRRSGVTATATRKASRSTP